MSTSGRYDQLPFLDGVLADGSPVRYRPLRFVPRREDPSPGGVIEVQPGDRKDLLAHRAYGRSEEWWRLADANCALDPDSLSASPGRLLNVPRSIAPTPRADPRDTVPPEEP